MKIDKELENKFAKAIVNMDFELLSEILHNDGEFNIQDKEFETNDVNKIINFIHSSGGIRALLLTLNENENEDVGNDNNLNNRQKKRKF